MMPNAWQYRLFMLSKTGVLSYYDPEVAADATHLDGKERGRIDLLGTRYTVNHDVQEGAPTQHIITLTPTEGEKWRLCAESKEDHARWCAGVEKYRNQYVERKLTNRQSMGPGSFDSAYSRSTSPHSRSTSPHRLHSRPVSLPALRSTAAQSVCPRFAPQPPSQSA
eukprot:CAMPEP_0173205870 /NCGR_PEP_ID=MMETSP1141-20130122/21005_1 /TAXON_ID=483371 /ORGANISM="non described non described, Strain CCMP2298" /LENGTH=165 /DNA_ID=CAMNT_0014131867 /DNA_START=290 /DNA_END=783 /DNA_ORIENTATION=-